MAPAAASASLTTTTPRVSVSGSVAAAGIAPKLLVSPTTVVDLRAQNPNTAAAAPEITLYLSMGEAHRRIADYLYRLDDAISQSDGADLAFHIAIYSALAPTPLSDALDTFLDLPHLSDFLPPLLRAIHSHSLRRRFRDIYASFEKAAIAFLQEFGIGDALGDGGDAHGGARDQAAR